MVNEKLPNYVVPDLTNFKVLIFVNFKDYLYIFECCESSKGKVPLQLHIVQNVYQHGSFLRTHYMFLFQRYSIVAY